MALQITLAQMTDLAIGTQFGGNVNFNILNTLIHAIIDSVNISNISASIREEDQEALRRSKHRANLRVEEQGSLEESKESEPQVKKTGVEPSRSKQGDEEQGNLEEARESKASGKKIGFEPLISKQEETDLSATSYAQPEEFISDFATPKDTGPLYIPPPNQEIFERFHEPELSRPVVEMWQAMKLAKHVDSHEQAIDKLMSMFQDLMQETELIKESNTELRQSIAIQEHKNKELLEMKGSSDNLLRKQQEAQSRMEEILGKDYFDKLLTWEKLEEYLKGRDQALGATGCDCTVTPYLEDQLKKLGSLDELREMLELRVNKLEDEFKTQAEENTKLLEENEQSRTEAKCVDELIYRVVSEVQGLEAQVSSLRQQVTKMSLPEGADKCALLAAMKRGSSYDSAEIACLRKLVYRIQCDVNTLKTQCFGPLGKNGQSGQTEQSEQSKQPEQSSPTGQLGEWDPLTDNAFPGSGTNLDCARRGAGSNEYIKTGGPSESHVEPEGAVPRDNRTCIEGDLENLLRMINGLEARKIDRYVVMGELSQRATKQELNDKVSQMCFDKFGDGLQTVINDILRKLLESNESIRNIFGVLDAKINREEFEDIKNQMETRLRCLAKRLVAFQRRSDGTESTAAVTKRPIPTKPHCLSCDRTVHSVTQALVPCIPSAPGIPGGKIFTNYTNFELEQFKNTTTGHGHPAKKPLDNDPYSVYRPRGGKSPPPPSTQGHDSAQTADCSGEAVEKMFTCRDALEGEQERGDQNNPSTTMKVKGGYVESSDSSYQRAQSANASKPAASSKIVRPTSASLSQSQNNNCESCLTNVTFSPDIAFSPPKSDNLGDIVLQTEEILASADPRGKSDRAQSKQTKPMPGKKPHRRPAQCHSGKPIQRNTSDERKNLAPNKSSLSDT